MGSIFKFLTEILMLKKDNSKIGLAQFKDPVISSYPSPRQISHNKEVKLSDLMRRAG